MRAIKHIELLAQVRSIATDGGTLTFRGIEYSEGVPFVIAEDYSGVRQLIPLEELTENDFIKE